MKPTLLASAAIFALAVAPAARAQYTFTLIADSTGASFDGSDVPSINSGGTVAFWGSGAGAGGGMGIFTGAGGATTTIAHSNGPIFSLFGDGVSINAVGTVAFVANLDGGGTGIFTGGGGGTTTIAESSGPTFSSFGDPSINTAGTVAFQASLDAGGAGIYLGDGGAGTEVIGSGDALFGSTLTSFGFGTQGLNDAGQIAFHFTLADGRTGIAVANPVPEPSSALLLGAAGGALLLRRRRV